MLYETEWKGGGKRNGKKGKRRKIGKFNLLRLNVRKPHGPFPNHF